MVISLSFIIEMIKKIFHSFLAFVAGACNRFGKCVKRFRTQGVFMWNHSFYLSLICSAYAFFQTVLASRKLNGSSFCKEEVDRNLSRSVKVWMLSRKTALPLAFSLSKPHFAPFHISTLATLHINKAGFSKATYLPEHYFMFTKEFIWLRKQLCKYNLPAVSYYTWGMKEGRLMNFFLFITF